MNAEIFMPPACYVQFFGQCSALHSGRISPWWAEVRGNFIMHYEVNYKKVPTAEHMTRLR